MPHHFPPEVQITIKKGEGVRVQNKRSAKIIA
jgi:hypothetical protein